MVKKKRIVNKDLISKVKEKPCIICNKHPVDAHHITSRGAGGDDLENNCISLCRTHHQELHQIGLKKFAWKYGRFKEYLTKLKRLDVLNKIYNK